MIHNCSKSIPDEEACKRETNEKANEGDDGDPFLSGIFVLEPRLLYRTFLDAAGVEVWAGCELEGCRGSCS